LLTEYRHQSRKRDPFFVKLFLHLSHFAESSTIKAERGREKDKHHLPSSSLSLKFCSECSTIKAAADTEFVVLLEALLAALMVLTPNRLAHSSPTATQNSSTFETDLRAIAATDCHQNSHRFEPRNHRNAASPAGMHQP
jgi:hypothetical protein